MARSANRCLQRAGLDIDSSACSVALEESFRFFGQHATHFAASAFFSGYMHIVVGSRLVA